MALNYRRRHPLRAVQYAAPMGTRSETAAKLDRALSLAATGKYRTLSQLAAAASVSESTLRRHKIRPGSAPRPNDASTGDDTPVPSLAEAAARPSISLLTEDSPAANIGDRIEQAKGPCTPEMFGRLAEDPIDEVRQAVAANDDCPAELLTQLASDDDSEVREYVADNPSCPTDVLLNLAENDPDEQVRWWVVLRDDCPAEAFQHLAFDDDHDIRMHMAQRSDTPQDLLEKLADDFHETVRQYVAERDDCPKQLLELLAADDDIDVRVAVAKNPLTPKPVLEQLADDETVRSAVAKNPACPPALNRRLETELA